MLSNWYTEANLFPLAHNKAETKTQRRHLHKFRVGKLTYICKTVIFIPKDKANPGLEEGEGKSLTLERREQIQHDS